MADAFYETLKSSKKYRKYVLVFGRVKRIENDNATVRLQRQKFHISSYRSVHVVIPQNRKVSVGDVITVEVPLATRSGRGVLSSRPKIEFAEAAEAVQNRVQRRSRLRRSRPKIESAKKTVMTAVFENAEAFSTDDIAWCLQYLSLSWKVAGGKKLKARIEHFEAGADQ